MKLTNKVKLLDAELTVKRAKLLTHLHDRMTAPGFRSFFITFALAPFLGAAIVEYSLAPKRSILHRVFRLLLPALKVWPLLQLVPGKK